MHHCRWFCLLYTKDHKNSRNVKALSWETGYEVTRVISWWDLLSQIAKMRDRSFANRVVLPVTAAIYRNGENQQCVGPLKRESGAKVTRCLILFRVRGLELQISVAR